MKKLLVIFTPTFSITGLRQSVTEFLYSKYVQQLPGAGSASAERKIFYARKMAVTGCAQTNLITG